MLKHKILSFAIIICLLFTFAPSYTFAAVQSGSCGDNLTWSCNSSAGTLTIRGTGDMYDYDYFADAPWRYLNFETVNIESGVLSIGERAFSGCTYIKTVNLPSTVNDIGKDAFYNCSLITEIKLPSSLRNIGDYAFGSCSKLSGITLTEGIESIGSYAFSGCALTEVVIPKSLQNMGDNCFGSCTKLTKFTVADGNQYFSADGDGVLYNADKTRIIKRPPAMPGSSAIVPDSVEIIGYGAFADCSGITAVTIPEGVTEIERSAFARSGLTSAVVYAGVNYGVDVFSGCKNLESVTIENGVKVICSGMFNNCSKISDITIPESVESIEPLGFGRCTGLKSAVIGSGVRIIDMWAFMNCSKLEKINIPDSVERIYSEAFKDCTNVSEVYIGSGLKSIISSAFSGDTLIKSITVSEENNRFSSDNGVLYNKDKTRLLIYPQSKPETEYVLPSTVKTIEYSAFSGCKNIERIVLNNGLEEIMGNAFYNCTALNKADIPESVVKVGAGIFKNTAFYDENDNEEALYNCGWLLEVNSKLKELTVSPGTKGLADGICSSWSCDIETVLIPASVKILPVEAFEGLDNLKQIAVDTDNALYSTIDGILYNKEKTQLISYPRGKADSEYRIPDTVTVVSDNAFYKCGNLTSVAFPNSVRAVGEDAFYECKKLESISLNDGLKSISSRAFSWCESLAEISIPQSVISIGADAFYYNKIYRDKSNWDNNFLYVSDCLVSVDCSSGVDNFGEELLIKEGTRLIADRVLAYNLNNVKKLYLPESLVYTGSGIASRCMNLEEIIVADGNTSLKAADGVLYDYDMEKLIQYSRGKNDTKFSIPDTVTEIGSLAMAYCDKIEQLVIPDSVKKIDDEAFYYAESLKKIIYAAEREQWDKIIIGDGNDALEDAELECVEQYVDVSVVRGEDKCAAEAVLYGIQNGKTVIAAAYKKNGRLLDAQFVRYDGSNLTFMLDKDADIIKVFVWNEDMSAPVLKHPAVISL